MAKAVLSEQNNKIRVNQQWCKGCGICIALCDKKVLLMDGRGKAIVANPERCTACGKCESHCPDFALYVSRSQRKKITASV